MSKKNKRRQRHEIRIQRRTAPGTSPGVIAPSPAQRPSEASVLAYGPQSLVEHELADVMQIPKLLADHPVVWVNVEGLANAKLIERLGDLFDLHRLALEDVVSTHQRAKVDEYGAVLFIVLRMVSCQLDRCGTEQLSLFVGPGFVITFQEGTPGDPFDRVRERIRKGVGKIRASGSDYLAYALIDAAIDAYYPVLELYAERIDGLEDAVLEARSRKTMDQLHEVKADLLILRRAIWPMREALAHLMREGVPNISDSTRPYLRDCYDHVVQIVELVETYRELTADLRDLYMSSISNRINETMRVLTIISVIFIPLTFIAGIYGMNFRPVSPWNMPELDWFLGYPFSLGLMAVTAIGMLIYFYWQGWIFRGRQ
ncbi:MAG TPA: magnesium/cobalt transporter CorA [Pirellulaceae bacterium]|nr:magnesium/cobalt transporter CorA [Pirellulaceae bacterium]